MFYYLSGTVTHIEPYLAVIDCGGVGYACRTTSYTLSALKKGDKGKLFTHLNVREDAMELYGFATQEELNLFQQLISVSGVGPKAALSILSAREGPHLRPGHRQEDRPAGHPGAERQAGQGPDHQRGGGDLWRHRGHRHPGEQAV